MQKYFAIRLIVVYLLINQLIMSDKKTKGIAFDSSNRKYVESVVSKGLSHTVNMIIARFREQNLVVDFGRKFDNLQPTTALNLSIENIDFVEIIKQNSFSFTLNCLIATAKEQGIKP